MGSPQLQSSGVIADFSGVTKVLEKISGDFADFRPRGPFPGASLNIEVKQLTALLAADKVTYGYTTIFGNLPTKLASEQSIAALISKLSGVPPMLAAGVSIGFEERSSKQSKRNFDRVEWKTKQGKSLFGYAANSSKVSDDVQYQRTALTALIAEAQLPLVMKDVPDGFVLERKSPGMLEIHVAGGFNDENPSSFSCEIAVTDAERLAALLVKSLNLMGSGKIFEYKWYVRNDLQGRLPDAITDGIEALRFASKATVASEGYELQSQVTIAALEDLERIRAALPAKEEIVVQVGAFKFDADKFANVQVRASDAGYRIELESRHPIPASLAVKYGVAP